MTQTVAWMLVDQCARQIGKFFIRIAERIRLRVLLKRVFGQCGFEMFQRYAAVETKLRSGAIEGRDSHGVIEGIVEPAKTSGMGCNLQARSKQPEIVTFPRPEHHPV